MRLKKKVMVIGIDGGTWYILDKFIKSGDMPNLGTIVAKNDRLSLLSTFPPITAPAWTTMRTGVNPGKHGIFGFTHPSYGKGSSIKGKDVLLVDTTSIKAPSLWHILSNYGENVGVFNVPFTYPVEKVNGVLVAGSMTGGEAAQSYPKDLISELITETGTRYFERAVEDGVSQSDKYIRHLIHTVCEQRKIDRYLLLHHNFGFYMTVYTQTDPLQHMFLAYIDENHPRYIQPAQSLNDLIREFYHEIDKSIGIIAQYAGDNALILILSDHGFQPVAKRFYLNNFLLQRRLLAVHGRRKSRDFGIAKKAIKAISAMGTQRILSLISYDTRRKLKKALSSATNLSIDYNKTQLFASSNQMSLHAMPGANAPELLDELCIALAKLRDGEDLVFEAIKLGNDVYTGPYSSHGPDLVFLPRAPYQIVSDLTTGELFEEQPNYAQNGTHSFKGILAASERGEKSKLARKTPELQDIAPTILYAMGYPVPNYMDGKVIKELFPHDWLKQNPISYTDNIEIKRKENSLSSCVYTQEESELIYKKLKDLGYM